jgi:uncharacterized protein YaeQ
MALRATIYKAELNVADSDRHYYESHALTLARHPSETDERMMVRLLAFALNAHEDLVFTKGISDADEPDLWRKDLTGAIDLWIGVGQPDERRILKACGRATEVVIYCYGGHTSKIWWDSVQNKLARTRNLKVVCLPAEQTKELATWAERTMTVHVNIQDSELFVSSEKGQITLEQQIWR